MHRDYPDDDEITLQYALALLFNYNEDDAHVRQQMEAGALALQVLQHSPQHAGAAHYAIHAFDSPDHAILALPAARLYARIAPAGSHAQHMPSHVFTQLGMWREVVSSNERRRLDPSTVLLAQAAVRGGLPRALGGRVVEPSQPGLPLGNRLPVAREAKAFV